MKWFCVRQAEKAEPQPSKKSKKSYVDGDGEQIIITIEHCTSWSVFKRRANEIFTEICSLVSNNKNTFLLSLNPNGKPKRGSFEIYVTKGSEKKHKIWSGADKGPPRKDKFPDAQTLIDDVNKAIVWYSFYLLLKLKTLIKIYSL